MIFFSFFCCEHGSWVHVRTASVKWFLRVPTIYVFEQKLENKVYPSKPQFYYIKVGCKGVYITRTCLHDVTIIIIIKISIFKEDNVFSIIASLPYGPPVNTDIDYYQTFFRTFIFSKCCNVSCAIFVRRSEASACLIMLSTKQGSHWYHF